MDDAYTIQISGNLVKQLAADNNTNNNKTKKNTRKPKPKTPTTPPPPPPPPPAASWPPPMYHLPIPPPPEVNGIRSVVEESERVLEKLQKQEDEMVVQVSQKAKQLREKEFKLPEAKPMPPCSTDLTACLDCYKQNVKDPLKCTAFVKSFADCARTIRQQVKSAN